MISIFDSGIGGISIVREVKKVLPQAPLFYFGDTAYMPYGSKTPAEIFVRLKWFIETYDKQTDMYVIACNSATVSLIDDYRKLSHKPFIGVEPGIKPAVAATHTKQVAVLATPKTANSPQLQHLIQSHGAGVQFHIIACDGLAEAIERQPKQIDVLLKKYLRTISTEVDTVVLACTHYPLILDRIQKWLGDNRTTIDVSPAVAKHVAHIYNKTLPQKINGTPGITFECSGDRAAFLTRIQEFGIR
ncbi:MAG TPA: glutamate racemase [Patescibacteria group bacterium]|nr:glutamate racemase [Patescibacteria group bacterium]